jgi:MoaA/NifB/PqqE/SkfB family radical SAM enzyme
MIEVDNVEEEVKKLEKKFGKTFCVMPFLNMFTKTFSDSQKQKKLRPCCAFNEVITLDEDYLTAFNDQRFKVLRFNLLNNVKDKGCSQCWRDEKINAESLREKTLKSFLVNYDIEIEKIITEIQQQNYEVDQILSFEFFPSNFCNFQCVMCNSGVSSSINSIERKYGNGLDISYDLNFNKILIQNLIKNEKKLVRISCTGGETILQKEVKKLIDIFATNSLSPNIVFEYVTNCSVFPSKNLVNKLLKFKRVNITLSIDGTDNFIEYQRKNSNWKAIKGIVEKYVELSKNNQCITLTVNIVVTALNVINLPDLIEWCFLNGLQDIMFTKVFQEFLSVNAVPLDVNSIINQLDQISKKITENKLPLNREWNKIELCQTINGLKDQLKSQKFCSKLNKKFWNHILLKDKKFGTDIFQKLPHVKKYLVNEKPKA